MLQIAARFSELGAWLQESGPAGLFHASPKVHEILGAEPGELKVLRDCWTFLHADDRAQAEQAQALCESQARAYSLELRLARADATERWVRLQVSPLLDAAGQPRGSEGAFRDISAVKITEAVLQESEMRFRSLIEGVDKVSVQGYDSQRRVIFWNKASENLYGYSTAEAIGRQLEDLIIPPAMRELVIQGTRQWLESGVVSVPSEELVLRHKNGSDVPVFSSHAMQRSRSGEAFLYCVDVDLSERVQAEATRAKLESQLREAQKLEAMGTMAGGIAHDFNNVLGAILANISLASELLGEEHPAMRHMRLISRGGERARSMVRKMLAFSRRQPHSLELLELGGQVAEGLALLRASLPKGVGLQLDVLDGDLRVQADASELQQVLLNLCSNAWQALPAKGGHIHVGLRRAQLPADRPELEMPAGAYAELFVRDDGCGIDALTQARIFEPFFTTKPIDQGTGLGLAVVHGIVRSHHGAIAIDSVVGKGSCFYVYLPIAEGQALAALPPEPAAAQAKSPEAPRAKPAPQGQRLIYVDDDEVMRLTVEGLLLRAGYRVGLCSGAEEALALLVATGQDVAALISDYHMPDRDGLSLANAVLQQYPGLPVLLSSGYISEQLHEQALSLGVSCLIKKENLLEELLPSIHALLGETPG
ncbi:PAS domain S-box-containing protein [Paucibacter oligotrophus]|uniref:histidine kinase n=1 Tax=Roseateles oligotrophus TaxID=1769250 RepID=A0A840L9B1_9BURK|nr:PAS domain-containing sensor histidine kinase [Roseateles oligotrophus]MBB4842719.1 PAS domain S-box-containing protein [Roseateles oligotrophus]